MVRINPVRLKVVLLGSKNFQQLVQLGTKFVAAENGPFSRPTKKERLLKVSISTICADAIFR